MLQIFVIGSLTANRLGVQSGLSSKITKKINVFNYMLNILEPISAYDTSDRLPSYPFQQKVFFFQNSDDLNSTLLHKINELSWLNISNSVQPYITINTTNSVYRISLNTVSSN